MKGYLRAGIGSRGGNDEGILWRRVRHLEILGVVPCNVVRRWPEMKCKALMDVRGKKTELDV